MGPRETYIWLPMKFCDSIHNCLPICVAGSGKSIFWFVISLPLSQFTVLILILSSAIIQHIMKLRDAGNATLAYFYFDFRDEQKQNIRNVVTSLLVQLSTYSKPCCEVIYHLYSTHGKGMQQPSNHLLIKCLKEMLAAAAQHPIFIIMDALDECPDLGMPTPREAVLGLVKDLVCLHLQVPNLHIFVTSRPEVNIQTRLKPLAVNAISLQDEHRQKAVISNYVSSVMSSDEQMKQCRMRIRGCMPRSFLRERMECKRTSPARG